MQATDLKNVILNKIRWAIFEATNVKISKSSSYYDFSFRFVFIFGFDEISKTDLCDLIKSSENIVNNYIFD